MTTVECRLYWVNISTLSGHLERLGRYFCPSNRDVKDAAARDAPYFFPSVLSSLNESARSFALSPYTVPENAPAT